MNATNPSLARFPHIEKNTSQQFTINGGGSFEPPGFLLGALLCSSLCTGDLPGGGGGHGIERGSLFSRLGESGVSVIADTGWGSLAIGGEGAPMWLRLLACGRWNGACLGQSGKEKRLLW